MAKQSIKAGLLIMAGVFNSTASAQDSSNATGLDENGVRYYDMATLPSQHAETPSIILSEIQTGIEDFDLIRTPFVPLADAYDHDKMLNPYLCVDFNSNGIIDISGPQGVSSESEPHTQIKYQANFHEATVYTNTGFEFSDVKISGPHGAYNLMTDPDANVLWAAFYDNKGELQGFAFNDDNAGQIMMIAAIGSQNGNLPTGPCRTLTEQLKLRHN